MAKVAIRRYLNGDVLRCIQVGEVMTSPVITINKKESFSAAEEIFVKKNVYYLPVVDDKKRLVGMLTQKYLYKTQSPRKNLVNNDLWYVHDIIPDGDALYPRNVLDSFVLERAMAPKPFSLSPDASLAEALIHITGKKIGCLPIVDERRRVVGILTHEDLVYFLAGLLIPHRRQAST